MAYTTIDKPSDYFNTVLYTGNGGSQNITGVGFSPDWVWLKGRNNANNHNVNDNNYQLQDFFEHKSFFKYLQFLKNAKILENMYFTRVHMCSLVKSVHFTRLQMCILVK